VSRTQQQPSHPLAGAEDTLKDFWTSRPRRPRQGRKIAGVAAGIANRYSIDPVIVRVTLVVSAFFGGAGLVLYLFGWLFFPEESDAEAPFMAMVGRGRSSTSTFFTVLLCLAMTGVLTWTLNDDNGTGLVGLVLLLAAVFLLHRHRAALGHQAAGPAAPAAAAPSAAMDAQMNAPVTEPESRSGPPAWDPLGAAPFAWDLPEPTPVTVKHESPAPRSRSRVGGITLGAALAVGGACALLAPYASWLTPPHIIGIVLAVIGLGMVGGSLVRGGRGLIGLAVPLTLVGFVLTSTSRGGTFEGSGYWGSITAKPVTIESVMPSYNAGGGTVDLDLTALPTTGTVRTEVNVGLGNVSVIVPPTADVGVTCEAGLGSVECLGQEPDAPGAVVRTEDNGTDGPGGLKIYLEARANFGTVEVRRAIN
jgi:phage shock protein PspC (stress-responsive transcriptional regulator)